MIHKLPSLPCYPEATIPNYHSRGPTKIWPQKITSADKTLENFHKLCKSENVDDKRKSYSK